MAEWNGLYWYWTENEILEYNRYRKQFLEECPEKAANDNLRNDLRDTKIVKRITEGKDILQIIGKVLLEDIISFDKSKAMIAINNIESIRNFNKHAKDKKAGLIIEDTAGRKKHLTNCQIVNILRYEEVIKLFMENPKLSISEMAEQIRLNEKKEFEEWESKADERAEAWHLQKVKEFEENKKKEQSKKWSYFN